MAAEKTEDDAPTSSFASLVCAKARKARLMAAIAKVCSPWAGPGAVGWARQGVVEWAGQSVMGYRDAADQILKCHYLTFT